MAKIVLIIAAIVDFIFRGLPAFFGCEAIANMFGLPYIEGVLPYAHPLGAALLVFGVMFFVASRDPVKYKFIMHIGILRYALAIVAHLITLTMMGSLASFWWIQMVVNLILLILFVVSRPKAATA